MTISLKTTIIFSGTLAVLLNVWQFAATYGQREDAFAPSWASAQQAADMSAEAPSTKSSSKLALAQDASQQPTPLSYTPPAPLPEAQSTAGQRDNTINGATAATDLTESGMDAQFASLYVTVSSETGTPWKLLAAVHKAETNQAGNTDRTSDAGATGPMQFIPDTFDAYAAPGHTDITSVTDAVLAAGRYLAANGASGGNYENAVYRYNHSWEYVDRVIGMADRLGL